MRHHLLTRALVLLVAWLVGSAPCAAALHAAAQPALVHGRLWTFAGHVYEGSIGETDRPLGHTVVTLYGSNDTSQWGDLLDRAETDDDGFWLLGSAENAAFYNLVAWNEAGYRSAGARTNGGTVVDRDWIQYAEPSLGGDLAGNDFWDLPMDQGLFIPLALRAYTSPVIPPTASLTPSTPAPTKTVTPSPSTPTATRTVHASATPTSSPRPSATSTPTGTILPPLELTVNTTSDVYQGECTAAHCTLRDALLAAEAHQGPVVIRFDIPASDPGRDANGVCTIHLSSQRLPELTGSPITLDGFTQPGASPNSNPLGAPINAALKIVLDGSGLSGYPSGIELRSDGHTIRGLVIQGFTRGIETVNCNGNRIEGCYIGTDVTGNMARGSSCSGILLGGTEGGSGSSDSIVGGSDPAARNLIAANGCAGIEIGPPGRARVQGNYIGTTASGTVALGNNGAGVRVYNTSSDNLIGGEGPGEANLIAYNGRYGVEIDGSLGATRNTIARNRIHTNTQGGIGLLSGGNGGLAAPEITTAASDSASGTGCPGCRVELFSDTDGQGALYEGTTLADATGHWSLSPGHALSGPNLTATVTDTSGNTSAFSAPRAIAPASHRIVLPAPFSWRPPRR